jgi:PBSX family phage terminase large subunit
MALSKKAFRYITAKPRRINLLHGSIRSSKTINSMLALPQRFAEIPDTSDVAFIGKTERTLYRNIIRPLQEMYGEDVVKYSKGSGEGSFNGRVFFGLGAHNENAENNVRGLTLAYILSDEVATYPESVTDMMLSRLSLEGSLADLTCNPAGPNHYLKKTFIDPYEEGTRNDVAVWHFLLEDNPNLPAGYLEFLKNQYPVGSLFYKRNILGLWVMAEGAVYDFYNQEVHRLADEPDTFDFLDISIDYGTTNPLAAGLFKSNRQPVGGLLCWLSKLYYYDSAKHQKQLTDSEYADRLDDYFAEYKRMVRYVVVDPSAASFILELKKRGWNVKKADNDVIDGIKHQAKFLQTGLYKLGPDSSVNQASEDYSAYLWDEKKQAKGQDEPLKGKNDGSHCLIAGTMIYTGNGLKPIEKVEVGETVLTRAGFKKVLNAGLTIKNTQVMKLVFSNGSQLVGTPNHRIFVQGKGYVTMDTVRYNDDIIIVCPLKKLSIKELFLGDSLNQKTSQTGVILTPSQSSAKKALTDFIEKFGKTTMEKFQRVATFTTKMVTGITMQLKTSSVYPAKTTKLFTANSELLNLSTIRKCFLKLQNGIIQKKVKTGIRKTLSALWQTVNPLIKLAKIAATNTRRLRRAKVASFAATHVNLTPAGKLELMRSLEHAKFAEINLAPTNTERLELARVVAVQPCAGKANVYDLTIQDLPEFFANGVLVHNSKDMERYYLKTLQRERINISADRPKGF